VDIFLHLTAQLFIALPFMPRIPILQMKVLSDNMYKKFNSREEVI